MVDLSGALLKLNRAKEHCDCLHNAIRAFLDAQPSPYSTKTESDPGNARRHLFKLTVARESPTSEWSVVVGDIAHNARTALDHLVFALSTLKSSDRRRRQLGFPICDAETSSSGPRGFVELARTSLVGVPDEHKSTIDALQPYKDPKFSSLARLRDINNTDKHRTLHIVESVMGLNGVFAAPMPSSGMFPSKISGKSTGSFAAVEYGPVGSWTKAVDGAVVGSAEVFSGPQIDAHPDLRFSIRFGNGGPLVEGLHVIEAIDQTLPLVQNTLDAFAEDGATTALSDTPL